MLEQSHVARERVVPYFTADVLLGFLGGLLGARVPALHQVDLSQGDVVLHFFLQVVIIVQVVLAVQLHQRLPPVHRLQLAPDIQAALIFGLAVGLLPEGLGAIAGLEDVELVGEGLDLVLDEPLYLAAQLISFFYSFSFHH